MIIGYIYSQKYNENAKKKRLIYYLSLVSITCNAKGTCFYYRDHWTKNSYHSDNQWIKLSLATLCIIETKSNENQLNQGFSIKVS